MVGKKKFTPTIPPVEHKENIVYVPQSQKAEWIPNISPECLKLETWLRMKQIPYEYLETTEPLTMATNSQLPYCKINGKLVPYSSHMLCEIAKMFNKETADCDVEPTIDNGTQRAFEGLIEGSLNWVLIYMRATQANQLPPCDVFQGRFWHFLRPLANKVITNKLKAKADHQGIGRQNASDVLAVAMQDLRAISAYLGSKETFCGTEPSKLDATAFAHLCQFWYIPSDNDVKTFMKEHCSNLIDYMENMKSKYWPDWDEKCRKPTSSARRTKSKEESQPVEESKEEQEKKTESGETAPAAVNGSAEKETSSSSPEKKTENVENGGTEEQKAPVEIAVA